MGHSRSWRDHGGRSIHESVVDATDHFVQNHQWRFGRQDFLETEIDTLLFDGGRNGFHFGHSSEFLGKEFLVAWTSSGRWHTSRVRSNTGHCRAESVLHDNVLSLSQGWNWLPYLYGRKRGKTHLKWVVMILFSFWIHNCKNDTKDSFHPIFFVSDKMCFTEHIIVIFVLVLCSNFFFFFLFCERDILFLHHDDNLSRKTLRSISGRIYIVFSLSFALLVTNQGRLSSLTQWGRGDDTGSKILYFRYKYNKKAYF